MLFTDKEVYNMYPWGALIKMLHFDREVKSWLDRIPDVAKLYIRALIYKFHCSCFMCGVIFWCVVCAAGLLN